MSQALTLQDPLESDALQRLRLTGLNWCLYAAAGLKTLSTTAVAIELLPWDDDIRLISFYFTIVLFAYVLAFVKRLGFVIRGWGLALFVYSLGVSELWNYGIASMGTLYFLTAVTLSALLFGLRQGTVWLGITTLTYGACAAAYAIGLPPMSAPQQGVSLPAWNWLSPGIVYLYCATATLILTGLFLRRLQTEIRQGEESVAVLADEVAERTKAEKSAREKEAQLRLSRERLRSLAASMDKAREQERAEVARWIHDELGQTLAAIALDAAWLRDSDTREEQPEERWDALEEMVRDAHRSLGRLATELRPSILDDLGLRAAVEAHLEEFARRNSIAVQAEGLDELDRCDGEAATAVFRIVQESLTNVARHAEAHSVGVRVRCRGDDGLELTIRDDGRGLSNDGQAMGTGLGILGMRERASLHGGRLAVSSCPEGGTIVSLRLPVAVSGVPTSSLA
ncbi:MAG: sensor histidine kinase [Gemmatimonadota bacterium]|jgi:signal transduction histidine kinase